MYNINGTTVLNKYALCHSDGVWKELGSTYNNFKLIAKDYRPIQSPGGKPCKMHIYGVETAQFEGINFKRDGRNGNGNGNQSGEIGLHTRLDGSENNVYHFDYAMFDFDRIPVRGGSPYMLDYIAIAKKQHSYHQQQIITRMVMVKYYLRSMEEMLHTMYVGI